jgi:hypothetical protein
MAKIIEKLIRFLPSDSPDVVTNKLYYAVAPEVLTYDSLNVDVGNTPDGDGYIVVDLSVHFPGVDEVYNLAVAAIDDGGNESDMKLANDVPLDFVAPNPVGDIEIL